jgi:DNA-binding transcriptional LysR family regulator
MNVANVTGGATDYLWPKLIKFLRQYPDIEVEISIDYGLTNIAAQRFDASVRAGEQVAKDMIAVRIEPDIRMASLERRRISGSGRSRRGRRT